MKKFKLIALFLFVLFLLVGCGENESTPTPDEKKEEDNQPGEVEEDLKVSIAYTKVEKIELGESLTIQATVQNSEDTITFETSDKTILSVNKNGFIKANAVGSATITMSVGDVEEKMVVEVIKPVFDITFTGETIFEYSPTVTYKLEYAVSNEKSILMTQGFAYSSSDETIFTIDNKGTITTIGAGKANVIVTSKMDDSYTYSCEVEVTINPMAILTSFNVESPLYRNVQTYGSTTLSQMVKGSVNLYSPMELNLIENIVPITNNSPYAGQTATEELLEKVEAENKYMRSGIKHTETTKITYHDTGNNTKGANAAMHAKYLVSDSNLKSRARSWHYTVDETCVIHHIPDDEVTWQGDHYLAYSTSIGIETCVDYGSELDITWHRTAKLMASLLVKYDMQVTDIVQHYDWNGKNCPQTLRMNKLYSYAIDMVKAEYTALTVLKDYTITFKSLNPEYVDDNGHIIAIPTSATEVAYIVTIKGENYNESKVLFSTIPGSDGSRTDINDNTNLRDLYATFNNINKDTYKDILAKYKALSDSDKKRASAFSYFLSTLKELLGGDSPALSIEEVYVGSDYLYQYFEIKNNAASTLNLKNYYLMVDDGTTKTKVSFNQKDISKGKTCLIFTKKNESATDEEVIYPDTALTITLPEKGKLELYNNEDKLIDTFVYDSSTSRIAYTGEENVDYCALFPSAINSKDESKMIRDGVTSNVIDTEVAILLIPATVTKEDKDKIDEAYKLYNALTSKEKLKVRNYTNLKNLKAQYDALS